MLGLVVSLLGASVFLAALALSWGAWPKVRSDFLADAPPVAVAGMVALAYITPGPAIAFLGLAGALVLETPVVIYIAGPVTVIGLATAVPLVLCGWPAALVPPCLRPWRGLRSSRSEIGS